MCFEFNLLHMYLLWHCFKSCLKYLAIFQFSLLFAIEKFGAVSVDDLNIKIAVL